MRYILLTFAYMFFLNSCDGGGTSGSSIEPISLATIGGEWRIAHGKKKGEQYDFRVNRINGGTFTLSFSVYSLGGGTWKLEDDILTIDPQYPSGVQTGKISGTSHKFTFETPEETSIWVRL